MIFLLESTQVMRTHSSVSFPQVKSTEPALRAGKSRLSPVSPLPSEVISRLASETGFASFRNTSIKRRSLFLVVMWEWFVCLFVCLLVDPLFLCSPGLCWSLWCRPGWSRTHRDLHPECWDEGRAPPRWLCSVSFVCCCGFVCFFLMVTGHSFV